MVQKPLQNADHCCFRQKVDTIANFELNKTLKSLDHLS
jgi:hypothetical protein